MDVEKKGRTEPTGFSTRAVHAGERRDPVTGSIVTPIYQASNFAAENTKALVDTMTERKAGYIYTRHGNPTTRVVEEKIAELEGVAAAAAFSSGMAAISTLILTLVAAGDHIVSTRDIYGGTFVLLNQILPRFKITTTFVNSLRIDEMEQAITPKTKLIFVESPTNPTLKLVDLARVGALGAARYVTTVIDNTFASPYNQQPAKYGFDGIIHSATKYLGGHNDLTAGLVCGETQLIHAVTDSRKVLGGVLDPHCAYLLLRGMKTLALRVDQHNQNGMTVARYLEAHPQVRRVYYPGLQSHPQYALAKRQMRGFGGVVSFELEGDLETTIRFVDTLKRAYLTPSLGGTETLITQPATTSHYRVPVDERRKQGISDSLIRLSLGVEDVEDILADLEQAFRTI